MAQLILQRGQPSPKVTSLLMFNIKRSKIEKQYIENTRKANINPSTVSANEMFVLNEMLEKQMGSVVLQSYCNTSIHTVALDSANDHWTLVGNWAQSPIGCLPGETSIPDLDLDSCYDDMNWLAENNLLRYPGDISMQIDSDDGFSNDNRTASFPIQLF